MQVRQAAAEDLDTIYMMGYDVWSEGASTETYLNDCRASRKYRMGTWYVLVDGVELPCSLIVYSSGFDMPPGYCGIGSVATDPGKRNRGYARELVNGVCAVLRAEGVKGVYLHSDIAPSFYERLGFSVLETQTSTCMLKSFFPSSVPPGKVPAYF